MPFRFLTPNWVVLDVLRLPLDALETQGIKGFIFDLDNTIMPPYTAELSEAMRDWLTSLTARGFAYIVVSNNHNIAYMKQAEEHIGVRVLGPAKKPSRTILREALDLLELPANQVCVVGDRPLTDIWGGQRLGATTILVDPLQRANEKGHIHVLRALERLFIQVPPRERCIGYTTTYTTPASEC
jgi:HAD superfamily phosphatase (TIGR01668 family)